MYIDTPEVREIALRCFPSYAGRSFRVVPFSGPKRLDSYWCLANNFDPSIQPSTQNSDDMKRFNPLKAAAPHAIAASSPTPAPATTEHRAPPTDVTEVQPASALTITISFNAEKKLVELHFSGKPDAALRSKMKAERWRYWSPTSTWYNKDTPANRAWANTFIHEHSAEVPAAPAIIEAAPEPVTTETVPMEATPAGCEIVHVNFSTVGQDGAVPIQADPSRDPMPAWRRRISPGLFTPSL